MYRCPTKRRTGPFFIRTAVGTALGAGAELGKVLGMTESVLGIEDGAVLGTEDCAVLGEASGSSSCALDGAVLGT